MLFAALGLCVATAVGAQEMKMGPMQGGDAPADARSPDYSDGIGHGSMKGMDMNDNGPYRMILIDQLEAVHGKDAHGQAWEAQGWYGNDDDKLWLRTEGDRSGGGLEEADVEAFWNHAIAPYWSTQLGARQDFGQGPNRTWAAFGVQGLAPYWFEVEATAYASAHGSSCNRSWNSTPMARTIRWPASAGASPMPRSACACVTNSVVSSRPISASVSSIASVAPPIMFARIVNPSSTVRSSPASGYGSRTSS
jgi:hypothetical protein